GGGGGGGGEGGGPRVAPGWCGTGTVRRSGGGAAVTAPAINPDLPAADEPVPVQGPVRGGPWPAMPPTYDRGEDGQAAFERAVARLWEHDTWTNPGTWQRELHAHLVLEGGGLEGIGPARAILVLT